MGTPYPSVYPVRLIIFGAILFGLKKMKKDVTNCMHLMMEKIGRLESS